MNPLLAHGQISRSDARVLTGSAAAETAGTVTSGNAETYALVDGQTLLVAVDGGAPQTATFNTGDFVAIGSATAAEIAVVINTDISGVTASDASGSVKIDSDTTGIDSDVQVTGGTANTELGFDTDLHEGTYGAPVDLTLDGDGATVPDTFRIQATGSENVLLSFDSGVSFVTVPYQPSPLEGSYAMEDPGASVWLKAPTSSADYEIVATYRRFRA